MSAITTGTRIGSKTIDTTVYRREEIEHGTRSVPDHTAEGLAEVWVDVAELLRILGPKALRARGKKAQALRGAIVVRIKNPRKLPL